MREHRHEVAGQLVRINVVETEDDLEGFRDFIRAHYQSYLGLDSETTGLDIYSDEFRCRVVQFGTADEAWVIPVEYGPRFQEDVRIALRAVNGFVLHNAAYDLQVFEQTLGVPMEDMWPKVRDTVTLAKLIDPRPKEKGGFGHSLEELTARFIDPDVAGEVKTLMNRLAKDYKTTKARVWKIVEFDEPTYQLYAGMDPILAYRLFQRLMPMVPNVSKDLVPYEHKLSEICSYIERKGFLLDVDYSLRLSAEMLEKRDAAMDQAALLGLENVNSPIQVAEALMARGVKITERTEGGQPKVDKILLEGLIKDGDELALAISEGKKWGKWEKTWVRKFLETADSNNYCHPSINPLQARTSRMSITGIPAQTLPSSDWMIRRCFLADPGQLIASVDYQTQELRVLAALSGDRAMIQAFLNNADLHQITADAAGVDRKVGKTTNFQKVYGGGAAALAKAVGIPFPVAKKVHEAFSKQYPGVEVLNKKLQREAGQNGYIVTPTGRRLPVDKQRAYSALNYLIQSSSRDVTCRALVRLHEAGFTPYLRLPIHDEIVASLPADQAAWGAAEIGRIMAEEMGPVLIGTDPEVGKRSWGSLYGADY
ncbi:DNA polymerase I [Mycobacterium phage Anthony]|uniref:DNA polymerase n=1 Tax=Mycobacterium phage Anthony TaxID=2599857 RepID=A0A5J6TI00_9CAUD|nr:DNA polymerase I [Mycobacterium phage Anthony]QFG10410.1 DNA polymerase I [Mycobacterium phage Anthony]